MVTVHTIRISDFELRNLDFFILNFDHLSLFGIWELEFGIFIYNSHNQPLNFSIFLNINNLLYCPL